MDKNKTGWYRINGKIVSEITETVEKSSTDEAFSKSMDLMALQIRELIQSHQSAVSYIPDGDFSRAMHTTSFTDKYAKYREYDVLPTGEGIWAVVFEEKKSLCLTENELLAHPRFKHFSNHTTKSGLEHPPLPGWLAVPILSKDDTVIGLLQLSDKFDGDYTEADIATLTQYSKIICHAFEIQYKDDTIDQNKKTISDLDKLAHIDHLTKANNRLSFDLYLKDSFKKTKQAPDRFMALFLIDLDSFKSINDTLGHPVGDALLVQASKRIRKCIRRTDFLARLGGDEFAIVMTEIESEKNAAEIASKIVTEFDAPFKIKEHEVSCSVSIGIADSKESTSPGKMLQNVDMALYRVKNSGKNNFQYYEANLDEKQKRALRIETHIKSAIDNHEFHICYQPIIDATTGKPHAREALIRWHNPVLGNILPDEFITLAEKSGRITQITCFVIESVCAELASCIRHKQRALPVSINISPSDLMRNNFADYLQQQLNLYNLPNHLIKLEITETAIFIDNAAALENLNVLSRCGFKILIDDFGTGYSSLSRLTDLPINGLKIDKAFIADINNEGNLKIIDSIIAIANSFDFDIIVEGIETEKQLKHAKNAGADFLQGYYLGMPA